MFAKRIGKRTIERIFTTLYHWYYREVEMAHACFSQCSLDEHPSSSITIIWLYA